MKVWIRDRMKVKVKERTKKEGKKIIVFKEEYIPFVVRDCIT
jgi:hypothetical protein